MSTYSSYSDSELLAKLSSGDTKGMKAIYQTCFGMVLHLVSKNGGTEADADKVFQECLYVFYSNTKTPGFRLNSKFKVHLYSIAKSLWFNELRLRGTDTPKIKNFEPTVKVDLSSYGELAYSHNPEFNKVQRAFRILGDSCQNLLSNYYFHHKPLSDIASELGITNEEIHNQKHRCIQNLKRTLK